MGGRGLLLSYLLMSSHHKSREHEELRPVGGRGDDCPLEAARRLCGWMCGGHRQVPCRDRVVGRLTRAGAATTFRVHLVVVTIGGRRGLRDGGGWRRKAAAAPSGGHSSTVSDCSPSSVSASRPATTHSFSFCCACIGLH